MRLDKLDPPSDLDQDRVLGPPDTELTLLEYGSYACPHCHAVHEVIARLALAFLLFLITASATPAQQQPPELFTYAELVQLYENQSPPESLQVKLDRLLTTPFINNAASARGAQPLLPRTSKLGKFVRIVQWNIEEGIEYEAISAALSDSRRFAKLLDSSSYPPRSQDRKTILQQVALMKQTDVIVLNEVDWGIFGANPSARPAAKTIRWQIQTSEATRVSSRRSRSNAQSRSSADSNWTGSL